MNVSEIIEDMDDAIVKMQTARRLLEEARRKVGNTCHDLYLLRDYSNEPVVNVGAVAWHGATKVVMLATDPLFADHVEAYGKWSEADDLMESVRQFIVSTWD